METANPPSRLMAASGTWKGPSVLGTRAGWAGAVLISPCWWSAVLPRHAALGTRGPRKVSRPGGGVTGWETPGRAVEKSANDDLEKWQLLAPSR